MGGIPSEHGRTLAWDMCRYAGHFKISRSHRRLLMWEVNEQGSESGRHFRACSDAELIWSGSTNHVGQYALATGGHFFLGQFRAWCRLRCLRDIPVSLSHCMCVAYTNYIWFLCTVHTFFIDFTNSETSLRRVVVQSVSVGNCRRSGRRS